jgi:hypothetical protein
VPQNCFRGQIPFVGAYFLHSKRIVPPFYEKKGQFPHYFPLPQINLLKKSILCQKDDESVQMFGSVDCARLGTCVTSLFPPISQKWVFKNKNNGILGENKNIWIIRGRIKKEINFLNILIQPRPESTRPQRAMRQKGPVAGIQAIRPEKSKQN